MAGWDGGGASGGLLYYFYISVRFPDVDGVGICISNRVVHAYQSTGEILCGAFCDSSNCADSWEFGSLELICCVNQTGRVAFL